MSLLDISKSFLKKNSSAILTCISVAGVISTAILTAKSTPKAISLLNEAKEEKGEELTALETVKTVAPAYIPAAVSGISTIVCILGVNALNHRRQVNLMSAYALLEHSYKTYKKKAKELYGEDADLKITEEVAKEEYKEENFSSKMYEYDVAETNNEDVTFFDSAVCMYFMGKYEDVIQKVKMNDGRVCYIINSPYDFERNYYNR